MGDDHRERLLASYGDLGEAMVVQNVLETGGVGSRVGDLGNLPQHMFGIAGAMGRSTGLWVLEADVERARELLAGLDVGASGLDESQLEAEALAAGEPPAEAVASPAPVRGPMARSGGPRWLAPVAILAAAALVALLAGR